jgi:hypothetical protein
MVPGGKSQKTADAKRCQLPVHWIVDEMLFFGSGKS